MNKLNQWLEKKCKLQHQGGCKILFIDYWHIFKHTPIVKQSVKINTFFVEVNAYV